MFFKFIFLDTTLAFFCVFTIHSMNNKEVDEETRKVIFVWGSWGCQGRERWVWSLVVCIALSFRGQIFLELNLKLENNLAV